MESWFGGGILFAVAAVLWLAYLVPNWLHRREYIATERNAVRLQQTIRVLAETAEAPEALRLENAAKARVTASKLSKQRVLAEARAAVDARAAAAVRLRRTRLAVTAVLAVAFVILGWQGVLAFTAGVEAVSVAAVLVTGLVATAGIAVQRRVDRTARERAAKATAATRALEDEAAHAAEATRQRRTVRQPVAKPTREWTPQPLPQPLGQVRREAMLAAARAEALGQSASAAEENARIAEVEERRRAAARAASATPATNARDREPVVAATRATASAAPASQYAAMGIVGDAGAGVEIDLDSAIARRRAS